MAAAWSGSGTGPASVPDPGTDKSRKPAGASAEPATAIPGTRPPLLSGRDRLNWASVTPQPASPPNFLSFYLLRSEVVLGRPANFSQQLSRGRRHTAGLWGPGESHPPPIPWPTCSRFRFPALLGALLSTEWSFSGLRGTGFNK